MPKTINLSERCYPGISQKRIQEDHRVKHHFFLKYVKNKVVIDIGCGEGFGAHLFKAEGLAKEVFGVDIDDEMMREASELYPDVQFTASDGAKVPLPENIGDIVIAFDSWHHMDSFAEFPAEVHRLLKPGGIFIFSVPNQKVIYLNPFRKKMLTEFYRKDFDKKTIRNLLKNRFEITEWYGQRFVKPLYINPLVKLVLFVLSKLSKKLNARIGTAFRLANGSAVLPLTRDNARSLIVVAKKI